VGDKERRVPVGCCFESVTVGSMVIVGSLSGCLYWRIDVKKPVIVLGFDHIWASLEASLSFCSWGYIDWDEMIVI